MFRYDMILVIALATVATLTSRIVPYFLVRVVILPSKVIQFFNYLPISIVFVMLLSSVFTVEIGSLPQVNWLELIVVIPTFLIMLRTKNVMLTVLLGCVCMALLRVLF